MPDCPKYSVIIPVYNAEKTLRRCVDSLLSQDYSNVEIILVNDGSADSSGLICREYAEKEKCVVCIEKQNGGVSTARNAGLEIARGKFVLFVDSDDFVDGQYFVKLDQIDARYDFVMFSHCVTDGKSVSNKILKPFESMDPDESVAVFCEALYRKTLTHPVTKRYHRSIVQENEIRFPEHLYVGEDKSFNLLYVMHCSSCYISSEPLYCVSLENENSLSRKPRPDLYQQLEMLTEQTQRTIRQAEIPEKYRQQFYAAENLIQLRAVYSEAKRMHLAGRDRKTRWQTIRQMCDDINGKNLPLPRGRFSTLLKIPVRLRMTILIDLMGWKLAN